MKYNIRLNETELFLIGGGSTLFDNNSFYLNDKFEFKELNSESAILSLEDIKSKLKN